MNKKSIFKKLIYFGVPAGLLFIIATGIMLYSRISGPGDGSKKVDFVVESGWGSIAVTNALYDEGLIESRTAFRMLLRLRNDSNNIKRGIYPLNNGMDANKVIDIITSGVTKTKRVTIPEGYNMRQIGDRLKEKGFVKDRKEFLAAASSEALLKKHGIPAENAEGYLYPDTYDIPVGYPAPKIADLMIRQFKKKTSSLKNFPEDKDKRHRLVILASIVEREAKLKEERGLIAGVFANRLEANYPLESCATIQYLFEKPKVRLYYKDLEIKSPYNTYKHRGLPPGPIASPGLPALKAALDPEPTEYKFFVVSGDDGGHHFSKTFGEHNRAKNKYILH